MMWESGERLGDILFHGVYMYEILKSKEKTEIKCRLKAGLFSQGVSSMCQVDS